MFRISDLNELIKKLPAIPFLFVGSGLTRRYYNLPDWRGLLGVFARKLRDDDYALARYENMAGHASNLPEVGERISQEFNTRWFDEPSLHEIDDEYIPAVQHNNTSPFKAEIATYIKKNSKRVPQYENEIAALSKISQKSLSGIITTNYDCFLESVMDGYTTYIGQEELIFSAIQGLAEIYKIHGCISRPDSIVVTAADYDVFNSKNQYLASKLMTIFFEYPIIFIGYSINDSNIKKILDAVVSCLSSTNIDKLKDRFIFVERGDNEIPEICHHSMSIGDKNLMMTKIKLSNYELLYDALAQKRSILPVKLLRFLKKECYNYVLTNKPTTHFRVAHIDDERLEEEGLAIAVGTLSTIAPRGLRGITAEEWYRHTVMDDMDFVSVDELLSHTFPVLRKKNQILPLHKFLSSTTKSFPEAQEAAASTYDALMSNSIIEGRDIVVRQPNRSVEAIWSLEENLSKKAWRIIHLYQYEVDLEALENILVELFTTRPDILSGGSL